MITLIKKQWHKFKRWHEATKKGYACLGRMIANRDKWNQARFDREIRKANRLYRLSHGHGNPWKPYKGF